MASKGTALAPFLEEAARHLPIFFLTPVATRHACWHACGSPAGTPAGTPTGTPAGTKHALSYHAACGHASGHACEHNSACSLVPCRPSGSLVSPFSGHIMHALSHHAPRSLTPRTSYVQLHVRLHPIAASRRTPDLFRTVLASLRLRCKKQGLALLRKVRCEQMPSFSLAQRLARAHLSGLMAISCGR